MFISEVIHNITKSDSCLHILKSEILFSYVWCFIEVIVELCAVYTFLYFSFSLLSLPVCFSHLNSLLYCFFPSPLLRRHEDFPPLSFHQLFFHILFCSLLSISVCIYLSTALQISYFWYTISFFLYPNLLLSSSPFFFLPFSVPLLISTFPFLSLLLSSSAPYSLPIFPYSSLLSSLLSPPLPSSTLSSSLNCLKLCSCSLG